MSKPVAIITGGASGIGLAVATHMHNVRGHRVVIADMNDTTGTAAAAALGPDATFLHCDVSSYASQARMFASAFEWGGQRLDFCHANAGIDDRASLYAAKEELDEEGLLRPLDTRTLGVNLEATVQGLWLFKYYVRKSQGPGAGRGKFVATSSAAGLYSMPTNPQYTASKYGIVGLTRAAGPVFAKENITVNCICPAFIPTNLAPPQILAVWPKEHLTPLSTAVKAIDAFLDDDSMSGQAVELSQENIYFREQVEWANESQRWIGEEGERIWEEGYRDVPVRMGY